jgi:two-component SAPR family response regulator
MLIGYDGKHILERRLQAAGCEVVRVNSNQEAFDHARHESFDTTVVVSRGSFINVAETILNLRDLNQSMEIIILIERWEKTTNRFFRQFIEHPIERTRILTRRQLQQQLQFPGRAAPPGGSA